MERGGGVAGDAAGEEGRGSTRLSLHLTNPRKTWNQKKERVQEMSWNPVVCLVMGIPGLPHHQPLLFQLDPKKRRRNLPPKGWERQRGRRQQPLKNPSPMRRPTQQQFHRHQWNERRNDPRTSRPSPLRGRWLLSHLLAPGLQYLCLSLSQSRTGNHQKELIRKPWIIWSRPGKIRPIGFMPCAFGRRLMAPSRRQPPTWRNSIIGPSQCIGEPLGVGFCRSKRRNGSTSFPMVVGFAATSDYLWKQLTCMSPPQFTTVEKTEHTAEFWLLSSEKNM